MAIIPKLLVSFALFAAFAASAFADDATAEKARCPIGRVYNACGSPCASGCPNPNRMCPAVCVAGCYCQPGTVDIDGVCVNEEKACKCTGNRVYSLCGNKCNDDCPDSGRMCMQSCEEGCFCPPGFKTLPGSDECAPESEACV